MKEMKLLFFFLLLIIGNFAKSQQYKLNELRGLRLLNKNKQKNRKLYENLTNFSSGDLPEGDLPDVFHDLFTTASSINKSDFDIKTMDRLVNDISFKYEEVHDDIVNRAQEIVTSFESSFAR